MIEPVFRIQIRNPGLFQELLVYPEHHDVQHVRRGVYLPIIHTDLLKVFLRKTASDILRQNIFPKRLQISFGNKFRRHLVVDCNQIHILVPRCQQI